ncbi:hypothetical protein LCGC14_1938180 [marine sediment metagenome]|uniref:Uncharacterized protein n=1 Tax=marine sediment metagenome TaxID=412755 RepID=A0A0F9FL16_9ZZZZ
MSIKSPATYAEWYWAQQVEAQQAFDESIEQVVSPALAVVIKDIPEIGELPPGLQQILKTLAEPESPGLAGFLTATAGEFSAEILKDAIGPGLAMLRRSTNRRARETWLTAPQAVSLSQRRKITDEYFYLLTASEGYEDIAADSLYTSLTPYPTIPEIFTWARYHGDPDNVKAVVWDKYNVPIDDFEMWNWLGLQRLTTLQVQDLYKRGKLDEAQTNIELAKIGWADSDRNAVRDLAYSLPNSMLLVQGDLQQEKSSEEILRDIVRADIHPDFAEQYMHAILTKPASQDLVAYQLRKDPELAGLGAELRKIGIHPDYFDVYKELAYQIPPVADIITMAVREAFSPAIAAKFGQYEDFPPDFAKYAAMKGLNEEWAKRYWAAHWNLPSPQQGFQMLHRGVIDNAELNMLMRAQDIMPFWRNKLMQIAYRPLTRVDVRRMYRENVLDEREVYESYLDQGYDEKNAERMAEFTVKQTLTSLSKFTSSDIVKAFAKRMISSGDAMSLLRTIGVRNEDADYIISTAEYKRQWAFTDQQIKGIRNLYKKRVYDDNDARSQLAGLNLPSDQIEVLMKQWYYDVKDKPTATWTTAQTLGFLKKGLVTRERAERELYLNGYDKEHVTIYMASIK